MDLSSILANEIESKKSKLKDSQNKKHKLKFKLKSNKKTKSDVEEVSTNTIDNDFEKNVDSTECTNGATGTEGSVLNITDKEENNSVVVPSNEEDAELLNSITDEQLHKHLEEFNELSNVEGKDKLDKIRHLQVLIRINKQKEKYKEVLESESKYVNNSELVHIDLNEVNDIEEDGKNKEVHMKIRVIIKSLVKDWENHVLKNPNNIQSELLHETKRDLVPLLYKLRSSTLSTEMTISLLTILYYVQNHDYRRANESYLKLSIGNVAWPIGVEHIGIHARSSATRISGTKQAANIMINDKTKRWITSIKRLITSQESIYTQ
ncbi:uncharacterized protein RJT21DRAFT_122597 [Scheffersomyces amazonensis]|uniref:uncharacterized protein n=1 Tax=Scheffersomyces amazonensis TaxID=1078765 RepID=UPI00315C523D